MATEPFPDIDPAVTSDFRAQSHSEVPRLRPHRKTSNLQGDPRGDTGGPSLATLYDQSPPSNNIDTPISSPITKSPSDRRRSKRKRDKPLHKRMWAFGMKHTWFYPLVVCLSIVSVYLAKPTPSNPVYPAIFLSYPIQPEKGADPDAPIQYGKGRMDFAFVAFYTVFLTFTREFFMQRLLRPMAIGYGMKTRAKQSRFMEQAYTAIYFAVFGPFGLYVMSRTDLWFFNANAMYEGFPHYTHDALFKAYYLLQASYWAQQAIVLLLMLERPRKDFKELVMHHIITLSLIWLSYRFHFTRMGLPVYITHDISDFFLATSKVLNYIDSAFVIPYFVFFMGAWTYLRHYQNLRILASLLPLPSPFPDHITAHISNAYSIFASTLSPALSFISKISPSLGARLTTFINGPWPAAPFASIGPYTLNWVTQQYKCWISHWITFGLLAALQAVNVFWLYLIFRVLYRILRTMGEEKVDERSEYDSEEEEERREELERMKKIQRMNGHATAGASKLQ
ncbi:longevity assurance proteins LAG1/LAC1 [Microthyrium microscopicum]|uniref:Longevity assurance proteins LAG1/LAC1 n=1 Tax=Microthyrium microscopicum TaxID=703497 RepID=A0A6A6UEH7_9PEZI|nr:longevity assurance proteins LAG1/LAC1 [Microthyrium microscopicum]